MQKIVRSLDYVPAVVFLMLAGFLIARLAIGAFPSDPLAWQAYITLAPAWRELAAWLPAGWGSLQPIAVIIALAALSVFSVGRLDWRRSRFVTTHLALLAVVLGMTDERVFSASVGSATPVSTWPIPDFSQVDPLMVGFLALTAVACIKTHRIVIWAMRHPTRRVQ